MSHVNRPLRRTGTLLSVMALIGASLVVAIPSATAATTCFGLEPTIEAVAGVVTQGTEGDDVIVGTAGPDVIFGNGGDDRICSKGGADEVDGGDGDDMITLGKGDDVARGGPGADLIRGKSGADRISGNAGPDDLSGGSGRDRISGGKGRDAIAGNGGHDILRGNSARDRLTGGKGDDLLEGGSAGDVLLGNSGRDTLRGQSGIDWCIGGTGADSLSGCEATTSPTPTVAPTATPTATPTASPPPESQADPEPSATPTTPAAAPTATPTTPSATPTAAPTTPAATPTATPITPTATPIPTATPVTPTATATPTPTPTPGADPVAVMSSFIDTSIVGVYGGSYPWLNTAWNYLQNSGTTQITDLTPGLAGTVSVSCSWSSVALGSCGNATMTIDVAQTTNIDVIIHELAHVLETPTGVMADPGPLGMAQMYFNIEWAGACDASEIFADTLLHLTKPDAYLAYYRFACPALPNEPTAEAEAVVASVLAGTDPSWFSATYANGTEAWAAVMTLTTVDRVRVVTNLADEFGGYCSISNTMITAFFGGTDPNPWADDGC